MSTHAKKTRNASPSSATAKAKSSVKAKPAAAKAVSAPAAKPAAEARKVTKAAVKSSKPVVKADSASRAGVKGGVKKATASAAKVAGKAVSHAADQSASRSAMKKSTVKTPDKAASTKPAITRQRVAKRSASTKVDVQQAKADAVAKARRLAPDLAVRIGSTPQTQFRGNPDIFGRLVEDHDRHRALLAMIDEITGKSPERERLFKELVLEIKAHAAAEEQALWSTVMRHPDTTDDARHAVGEHKEMDKLLADLAARDMAKPEWRKRFAVVRDEYLHHIREEEQEQFEAAEKVLTKTDVRYMKQVFERRKKAEKASAKIEKKIRLKD